MTRQSSFKRIVRVRMEKTGESYTSARAALVAGADREAAGDAPVMQFSDERLRERTGRGWEEWFDLLDRAGAGELAHGEIATWLTENEAIGGWWAQAVTVGFERARGGRGVGEYPEGFTISVSKTVAVAVERLYDAVADESERARWLPDADLSERTATRPKSARYDWGDGATRVVAYFEAKGAGKSTVVIAHERLPDAFEAERMKAWWRERLGELRAALEATDVEGGEGDE